ncbi:MAG: cysteine desulfurase family protein [Candidatus Hodarchaeota archaeon]
MKIMVYMDNERSTMVAKEVIDAMISYFDEHYGHPASIHGLGEQAHDAIEESAETIAQSINAKYNEIVFTSGGTEANDLAIRGIAYANKNNGKHIITSRIEHPSIMRITEQLSKQGFEIDYLDVDEKGFIDMEQLKQLIRDKTILVSIMHANHEIGTIQPIKEIGEVLKDQNHKIHFHVDGQASYTRLPIDVQELNLDALTLSAHKIHGPKGIGAIYSREKMKIDPILLGYVSLSRLRPGTENVPGIVGFAKAAEIAFKNVSEYVNHMKDLRDELIERIENAIPEILLHGPRGDKRSPNNVNFSFKYIEGEAIMMYLNMNGVYVSTGSACASRKLEPSHVLTAIGIPPEVAHGSILFALSRYNTKDEVDYVLEVLPKVINQLRSMSPLWHKVSERS